MVNGATGLISSHRNILSFDCNGVRPAILAKGPACSGIWRS
jgi:hypothetical protein